MKQIDRLNQAFKCNLTAERAAFEWMINEVIERFSIEESSEQLCDELFKSVKTTEAFLKSDVPE